MGKCAERKVLPVALSCLLLGPVGCDRGDDPCLPMCEQARDLFGECLDASGLDWTAAGYEDAQDYLDACLTWAWEMRILADSAGEPDAVDEMCAERETELAGGDCDTYSSIDWNAQPWQQ